MENPSPMGKEIAAALVRAQGAFKPIIKNKTGYLADGYEPFSYADLGALIDATRGALTENGLAVLQPVQKTGDVHELVTMLVHTSGESLTSRIRLGAHADLQRYGAELSLMQRYAYRSILCLAAEEDLDSQLQPRPTHDMTALPVREPSGQQTEPQQYSPSDDDYTEIAIEEMLGAVKAGEVAPANAIQILSSRFTLSDEQKHQILSASA